MIACPSIAGRLRSWVLIFGVATTAVVGTARAASPDDDFADGTIGSQWQTKIDTPAALTVAEQNGRLELLSAGGPPSNDDALYLSRFRLSTASNFSMQLDYSFTGFATAGAAGSALAVDFGVGFDEDGQDSAAIAQGFATTSVAGFPATGPFAVVGYRVNDAQSPLTPSLSTKFIGTFRIDYDATADKLTLQEIGGGLSQALTGLVHGTWHADSLLVSFGGRGYGFSATTGQAFVDNFSILDGTLVPEPACLTLVSLLSVTVKRRRISRDSAASCPS